MMATTHVFAGLLVASAVALVEPTVALEAGIAAIVGGLFPDLDVVATHRKTLHFPVYYAALAVPASGLALVAPSGTTVAVAVFLLAAAAHSVSDALGGGHELRPWEGQSPRAVYSHYHGRWLEPRRWIGYDGSPGDLAAASVLALPALFVFDGFVRTVVVGMLVVSIGYAAMRKAVAAGAERFVD
ncbi:metal-dependent hydrolase [Natrarchaeobius sp. A-rgal3]|uniref:metal-dependent hydrolase n=1 Tax=Natrarchaeobius versutus TaxID=1679078 RepID=UPI00350F8598